MFEKVPLTFEYDDLITVTWHILSNLIMMLLKIGQQKNPQNLKLERITNQKIQKLSKTHVYIVKYRHLNTWDTHVPMGMKGLIYLYGKSYLLRDSVSIKQASTFLFFFFSPEKKCSYKQIHHRIIVLMISTC